MKPSRSRFHRIHGLNYHLREWGETESPKVFMLHGWMDVSASFQFLVDALEREWHVIAPDWRGFGLTDWAQAGYWFPDYLGDLDAIIDLYSPRRPVYLVGHSMGGNIACLYAGTRPDRVAAVISLEGFGVPRTDPAQAPQKYAQWLDAIKSEPTLKSYRSYEEVAERLIQSNPRLAPDKARWLAQHWARTLETGEIRLRADPRHKRVNPVLYRIEEAMACWSRAKCPVLWVSGGESWIRRWINEAPEEFERRKRAFASFSERAIDAAGHMLHHDQPERTAALIEEFLSPAD